MSHHDVIVVGTGLAGLTAAVRLAESGARVLVLAKGVGATHLSGGTVDVLGYDPDRVASPAEALARVRPEHPYGRVGADAVGPALEWFKGRFAEGPLAPYAYTGGLEENLLLPSAVGVPRPSAVVPESLAGGDLRGGGELCVVGFRALKDFYAAAAGGQPRALGSAYRARSAELDLMPEGRADGNALGFARAFDTPAFRAEVAAQVSGRLGAAERVAFPAVLGIADPHAVWTELSHRLGRVGVRGADAAAVGAGHARVRHAARRAAPRRRQADSQRGRDRRRA